MAMSLPSLGGAYRPNFNVDDPTDSLNRQYMGGGMTQVRPTPEQVELEKLQSRNAGQERMFGAQYPPSGAPQAPSVPALSTGGGGFSDLINWLKMAGTDTSTNIEGIGGHQIKGLADVLANILNTRSQLDTQRELGRINTGAGLQQGLTGLALQGQTANQNKDLAVGTGNQARDKYLSQLDLFRGMTGYQGAPSPGVRELSARDIDPVDTTIDLDRFNTRPSEPADSTTPPPPRENSQEIARRLGSSRGVPQFRLPAGAMV